MGLRRLATCPYHRMGNSDTEHMNYNMTQILFMVVNMHQNDGDEELSHLEADLNYSHAPANGSAPNEMHLGTSPHLPLTVIESRGASGNQSLGRNQLEFYGLARERQQCTFRMVRESHVITSSPIARANRRLNDTLHNGPRYAIGHGVWVCNGTANAQTVQLKDGDEVVLKSRFSLDRTAPLKIIFVSDRVPFPRIGSPLATGYCICIYRRLFDG